MFRIEVHETDGVLVLCLYGRLSGEYASEIRKLLASCKPEMTFVVDLTEVTFVDSVGEELLSALAQLPARFTADNAYAKHLCERLDLPLADNRRHKKLPARIESPLN